MLAKIGTVLSGFLFALGLGLGGATDPAKIVGMLDFTGRWDPTIFVMIGAAVATTGLLYRLVQRTRQVPVDGTKFRLPTRRDIDGRLVLGATLFGAGWGLGGYCPGPALTVSPTATAEVGVFLLAMFGGMALLKVVDRALARRRERDHTARPSAPSGHPRASAAV